MKILVVEDDQATGSVLTEALTEHYYTVNLATDGEMGLQLANAYEYDLIVLDVMIPKLDGISLCQTLRQEGYQNPILLLTGKDSSTDQVMGLDAGADDYVVKPFNIDALLARIRALLRRGKVSSSTITWENLSLDPTRCEVTCADHSLHLTSKEYCLLELFLLNPTRIFSRRAILDRLWDFAESPGEQTVSTHIKCLRQKLKAAGSADPIETVHGLGYRLRSPLQSPDPLSVPSTRSPTASPAVSDISSLSLTKQQQQAQVSTQKIWEKFKGYYLDQVTLLEDTARLLKAGEISAAQQQAAKQAAHKLAGSLGLFGFPEGSHLSHRLEEWLASDRELSTAQMDKFSMVVMQLYQIVQQGTVQPALLETGLDLERKAEGRRRRAGSEVERQAEEKAKEQVGGSDHTNLNMAASEIEAIHRSPKVLMIGEDLKLMEQLQTGAIARNIRVEMTTNEAVAYKQINQDQPEAIMLDLDGSELQNNGLAMLQKLIQHSPRIPVLVITSRESLSDRIEVTRSGGCAFLHKSLPTHQILETIQHVLSCQSLTTTYQVLIVDDDLATLAQLSTWLSPLGVHVHTLSDPEQFWTMLNTVNPDLLVLDVEMPNFSGVELCQVVRQDPIWQHLPILFFSTHTHERAIAQAFIAGADSYISKSSAPEEVIHPIIRHLQRARSHRNIGHDQRESAN